MLKKIFYSNKNLTKQTIILLIAQSISMLLSIVMDILNTKILGKEAFGLFSFINTLTFGLLLFFDFGIFSSGSRLLALIKNKDEERSLMGLLFLITLLVGLFFSITIFMSSFFVNTLFNVQIEKELQVISFLVFILPFQALIPMICRGTNLIFALAVYTVVPKVLYLIMIILFISSLNYSLSFILFCIAIIISSVALILYLKPNLKECEIHFQLLRDEIKNYGIKIYSGNILGNISQYLDRFLITLFMNTNLLGSYSIALKISSPLKLVSQSLSVSAFKEFTEAKKIDNNIIKLNIVLLAFSSVLLILFTLTIVKIFFESYYFDINMIIPVIILGLFFTGLTQPINSFLGAKRKGEYVRNIAIISPLINIALNCILIPFIGLFGAALALAVAQFFNLVLHIYYYKRTIMELV